MVVSIMESVMSDISKIAGVLLLDQSVAGLTVDKIARKAYVTRDAVYKRVHDLRNEGFTIYSNYRNVNGVPQLHYRMR